jgi:hypothetical protein
MSRAPAGSQPGKEARNDLTKSTECTPRRSFRRGDSWTMPGMMRAGNPTKMSGGSRNTRKKTPQREEPNRHKKMGLSLWDQFQGNTKAVVYPLGVPTSRTMFLQAPSRNDCCLSQVAVVSIKLMSVKFQLPSFCF